ncbi:hypothetical protein [Duganella aceris]|uniref:Uncharacterized protein n=1 Tax=Duganella aceris TaxID=2703883 RepID=A0ABX0FPI6_9BURK|nr:hypothetical protein [Duganella aceris]NGZ86416.1 hypothetical protein [Duganella aceris]
MEKFSEFVDAVTARISNPLFTSFVISWLITNYKAVLVVISKEHYSNKISFLETTLYGPDTAPLLRLIGYPLIGALLYSFVLPVLSILTTAATGYFENKHESAKAWAQNKRRFTLEQSNALRRQVSDSLSKQIDELQVSATAIIDSNKRASDSVEPFLAKLPAAMLYQLEQEAQSWNEDVVRPDHVRDTHGPYPLEPEFWWTHGVPKRWLKLQDPSNAISTLNLHTTSRLFGLNESDTMDILARLLALQLVTYRWVDNQIIYGPVHHRWTQSIFGPVA